MNFTKTVLSLQLSISSFKNGSKPFMSCSTNTKTDQDFENPSRNKEIIADFGSQVSKKW